MHLARSTKMKRNIILFSTLIITLSTTASADWWDGWNNTSSTANTHGNSKSNTDGNIQGSGTGAGKTNNWGTSNGDIDGSVGFSMNFKGKGRAKMDTKMAADNATNTSGNTQGSAVSNTQSTGYLAGYGTGSNNQNNDDSQFPFRNNNNFFGHTNRMPMGYSRPNFNNPLYGQTPYLYRPLPMQTSGMQIPYGNQRANGYPMPMNQQSLQIDNRLKNMQKKMNNQEKQYNAFVAKMKAQQKEMMDEFAKQQGVTTK